MTTLNTLHQSRWNSAVNLFTKLKTLCQNDPSILLLYDGDLILPEQIVVTKDEIVVQSGSITYDVFIADPLYDSGLYKSIKEFKAEVKQRFRPVKLLKF
jgi:hypothetical protein